MVFQATQNSSIFISFVKVEAKLVQNKYPVFTISFWHLSISDHQISTEN